MSKYNFDRMGADQFQHMVQSLLERKFRLAGNLVQFGDGHDGGREALWQQLPNHAEYIRPANEQNDVPKQWVFQVKFHDIGQRGWSAARSAVVADLDSELNKIVHKHRVPCHAYILATNVPFTGSRNVGTRDQILTISKKWQSEVPEIYIWDAADLSRMLDADASVRTSYLDTILTGDVLLKLLTNIDVSHHSRAAVLKAYLLHIVDQENSARTHEAGDEEPLKLSDLFVDLTLSYPNQDDDSHAQIMSQWPEKIADDDETDEDEGANSFESSETDIRFCPTTLRRVPSSFALLLAAHESTLILGGPGLGKSTLTQVAACFHAARIVKPEFARRLCQHFKLPPGIAFKDLDGACKPRIPIRVELRHYARWIGEQELSDTGSGIELARYIVDRKINPSASAEWNMDDLFEVLASNPTLLMLDGLDEVPNSESRREIVKQLQTFLNRIYAADGDIQLIFSSRPKGYAGEFTEFEPLVWHVNELSRIDFNDYCKRWLDRRIKDLDERTSALSQIEEGMQSEAVKRLATSLLQATVMLTIVRAKQKIPHQRHKLYAKYVDVTFARESDKWQIVAKYHDDLERLHRRVGFELFRRGEGQKSEPLDQQTFRQFVYEALQDRCGAELGDNTLREIVDDITDAATDRLCMIAGTGPEQSHFDFVLQSFREYFAATYLANSPEADTDKVFQMLVRRGPYWANVLQFYAAQINPPSQARWILDASATNEPSSFDEIIDLVRRRRALLSIAHELAIHGKRHLDQFLGIVFSDNTLWTWESQGNSLALLAATRNPNSSAIIWEKQSRRFGLDETSFSSQVAILAHILLEGSIERKEFETAMAEFLDTDLRLRVLDTAWHYSVDIDLSRVKFVDFVKLARDIYSRPIVRHPNDTGSNPEIVLRMEFAGVPSYRRPRTLTRRSRHLQFKINNSVANVRLAGFISANRLSNTDNPRSNAEGDVAQRYYYALADALNDRTNSSAHLMARKCWEDLTTPYTEELQHSIHSPDMYLGPSPNDPRLAGRWEELQRAMADFISSYDNPDLPSFWNDDFDQAWPILFFSAEKWNDLANLGLIPPEQISAIDSSVLAKTLRTASIPLNWYTFFESERSTETAIDLSTLFRAAIATSNRKDWSNLTPTNASSAAFDCLIRECDLVPPPKGEMTQLLDEFLNLPPLPVDWGFAVLRLAVCSSDIDIDRIIAFLERMDWNNRSAGYVRYGDQATPAQVQLILSVLKYRSPRSLAFAAALVCVCGYAAELSNILVGELANACSCGVASPDISVLINGLLILTKRADDLTKWQDPQLFNAIDGWKAPITRAFMAKMWEAQHGISDRLASPCLHDFVLRHRIYPSRVAQAALDAALDISGMSTSPLADAEWQVSLHG